ncbi:MAG: hypothetical protein MJ201_00385 [Mycoplasmoidaceae bacterium]|nr:hypothetical protein [Mycoplasmoidaceae bacterium]
MLTKSKFGLSALLISQLDIDLGVIDKSPAGNLKLSFFASTLNISTRSAFGSP